MKTVFLFIKNSLFISDLLRSRYIQYLASKYQVVIFSTVIDEMKGGGSYLSAPNVIYVPWKVQNPKLFSVFKFLRTACMRELHWLAGMKIYYQSPKFKKDKRARLLRWLSRPLARWLTVDMFTKLELLLARCPRLFIDYCNKYRPSLVITATPGIQVFDAEAIILAKKMGIPTLATNFSWDNLTAFKAVRLRKPDFLFVWNEVIRQAAIYIHKFDPSHVFVTGSMRFDRYFQPQMLPSREEFLRSKNLDPRNKTILFATVGQKCRYQFVILRNILRWRENGSLPYVNVLIRLHPFDGYKHYREFVGVKNLCVEKAGKEIESRSGQKRIEMDDEDFLNLKATLSYADVNINYKSTISLEAFIFDQPVINFIDPEAPAQAGHYHEENSYYYPLIKEKSVRLATTEHDLAKALNDYLADRSLDGGNRKKVAEMFFFRPDGLSYRRNVDLLSNLLEISG